MIAFVKHIIRFYQMTFLCSRQFVQCKYHPSCSDYMLLALDRYGLCGGIARGVWRIMRCNPFAKGGIDLP